MSEACDHELQKMDEGELAELRRHARRDRPPMAWVEEGHRCGRCGSIEAVVTWNGQAYRVPVEQRDGGVLAVRWPRRGDAPGGAVGMG